MGWVMFFFGLADMCFFLPLPDLTTAEDVLGGALRADGGGGGGGGAGSDALSGVSGTCSRCFGMWGSSSSHNAPPPLIPKPHKANRPTNQPTNKQSNKPTNQQTNKQPIKQNNRGDAARAGGGAVAHRHRRPAPRRPPQRLPPVRLFRRVFWSHVVLCVWGVVPRESTRDMEKLRTIVNHKS